MLRPHRGDGGSIPPESTTTPAGAARLATAHGRDPGLRSPARWFDSTRRHRTSRSDRGDAAPPAAPAQTHMIVISCEWLLFVVETVMTPLLAASVVKLPAVSVTWWLWLAVPMMS